MRKFILATSVAVGMTAAVSFAPGKAHADPYKWCAVLNMGDAAYNCGFVTIEQCRATVSGIGGFCELNQYYIEPGRKPEKIVRSRRAY